MRMVPVRPWLRDLCARRSGSNRLETNYGKTDLEDLGERFTRADGALGYTCRTVHGVGPVLEEAMEVQAGALIPKLIGKANCDLFPNVGMYRGGRPLPVNGNHWSLMLAIGIRGQPTDVPIVFNSGYTDAGDEKA